MKFKRKNKMMKNLWKPHLCGTIKFLLIILTHSGYQAQIESSLYFFLPRSSRKNAQNRFPLYSFGAILGVFFRYERLCFDGGILYRPSFKNHCLSLPGNKKAPYCYDAFSLLGKILNFILSNAFSFCRKRLLPLPHRR